MKVLIAEDDALKALAECEIVANAGHECVGPVSTKSWALEAAAQHGPDCALVDVILRDGYTGVEFASELHRLWGIACILVSGAQLTLMSNTDSEPPHLEATMTLLKPNRPASVASKTADAIASRNVG
jgi:two-component SAPR family response regulator